MLRGLLCSFHRVEEYLYNLSYAISFSLGYLNFFEIINIITLHILAIGLLVKLYYFFIIFSI